MPKISFPLADLRALAELPELTLDEADVAVRLVKGELVKRQSSEAELRVELQDTNRPDTWCVEGIARQLRVHHGRAPRPYPFFEAGEPAGAIEVDPSVEAVRPFVAGFVARGYAVDEPGLLAFIAAQEVLCRNFGRMRKSVAIGIYDASRLVFPVRYEAAAADDPARAFVPLRPGGEEAPRDHAGAPIPEERWERPWTPAEILRDHPTGREYAAALPDPARAPLLCDAAGEVLSFPPIINSAGLGRVTEGMSALFVEVTGTVQDQVLLAANILAANLADRGATIERVVTRYPYDTPRGREVLAPHPLPERRTVELSLAELGRTLGEPELAPAEVRACLERFGLSVAEAGAGALRVSAPAYRNDYLHPVDAIEDFAISRGYEAFEPLLPDEFTVGALSEVTRFEDLLRDRAIGCGLEETIGNLLTAEELLRARMQLDDERSWQPLSGGPLVRIENVMNRNYGVLRDWLLPTLLEVEAHSTAALYPHRFFEAGEVCLWDAEANHRSRTERRLAAAIAAHREATFSDAQAYLHALLEPLGVAYGEPHPATRRCYRLVPAEHPSFIPGRAAWIDLVAPDGELTRAGLIGELHPGVLERWGIRFPMAAFELVQDRLRSFLG